MIARADAGIRIEDLRKSFDDQVVLDGLSLEVRKSELLGVIGRSGSGKSVLLRHVVGLLKPDSGRVIVGGVDMGSATPEELDKVRDRIGYLFQGAALLNSLTVFDNVALPLRERNHRTEKEIRDEVLEKLDRVGLAADANKYPGDLSGGMKKRAGLARAIVGKRDIFLYDEPTAGLDPSAAASIIQLIRSLQGSLKATSILVSHDMALVFGTSDRVAVLESGKIGAVGTPDEIRRSSDPLVGEFLKATSGSTAPSSGDPPQAAAEA